jgi:hypothetical protein
MVQDGMGHYDLEIPRAGCEALQGLTAEQGHRKTQQQAADRVNLEIEELRRNLDLRSPWDCHAEDGCWQGVLQKRRELSCRYPRGLFAPSAAITLAPTVGNLEVRSWGKIRTVSLTTFVLRLCDGFVQVSLVFNRFSATCWIVNHTGHK